MVLFSPIIIGDNVGENIGDNECILADIKFPLDGRYPAELCDLRLIFVFERMCFFHPRFAKKHVHAQPRMMQ